MTREEFIARIVNFVDIGCERPDLVVEARYLAADLWDQVGRAELIDLRGDARDLERRAGSRRTR